MSLATYLTIMPAEQSQGLRPSGTGELAASMDTCSDLHLASTTTWCSTASGRTWPEQKSWQLCTRCELHPPVSCADHDADLDGNNKAFGSQETMKHARKGMCSPPDSIPLLQMLVRLTQAKNVVEVGVFTGKPHAQATLKAPAPKPLTMSLFKVIVVSCKS